MLLVHSFVVLLRYLVYEDTLHQMSKSASGIVSQATSAVNQIHKSFGQSKDYAFRLGVIMRCVLWLKKKCLIKMKSERKRDELLQMMHDAYGSVANLNPVLEAWSDTYPVRFILFCLYLVMCRSLIDI